MGYNRNNYQNQYQGAFGKHDNCSDEQKHVHEIQGSVMTAEEEDPHQHRFCIVSEEAMSYGNHDHVHEVCFRTDTFDDHYHEFKGKTGGVIPVGNHKHVHFLESVTSVDDGHRHRFECATLIENPTGKEYRKDLHDHRDY